MRPARALRLSALLPALALAGCTFLHSNTKPEQTYYLRPPQPAAAGSALTASLRVGHVTAGPGLDSPHIMLVQADHRMDFFAGSRWPAPATEVVESLAVDTLRASGVYSSVEDSTSPFPSDYLLQLVVRRFEADYTQGGAAPVIRVTFDCIVGRREGRDVVATFEAAASAPAGANRLGEVVAAFEQATTAALNLLSQQASQAVRTDLARAAPSER